MPFVHALFLLGGLAAAVPVLIHMSKSRKYQRVRIGTLRFLSSVIQERRRFRKIENWPLLLARIAVLILLALLFARPYLPEKEPVPPEGAETIVLVDSSGSLAHAEAAERIGKIVDRIRDGLPPEGQLTMVEFADAVRLTDEPAAVPGAPTDFAAAIDWTIDHLANSPRPPAAIHLITDLQQSPLPASPPRLWPTGVKTEIHAVPTPENFNLAVEKVELATPFRAEEIQVEAVIRVYGDPPARLLKRATATLVLDQGKRVTVPLPEDGGRVRFRWKPGAQHELAGTVTLSTTDPWPVDNQRHFSFTLQERKKILLVDGDPGNTPFLGEAYFLQKALLASGASHGQSPFLTELTFGLTGRPGLTDLDAYDAIAFCNVGNFTSEEAEALARAHARGTGLIFFLGHQVNPTGIIPLQSRGLLPPLEIQAETPPRPVVEWDTGHPALALFQPAALRRLVLRDAFALALSDDWKALASFPNQHPLLACRDEAEAAPLLVFAHPLTREWGDLPIDRSFVPLMRELFVHLAGYRREDRKLLATAPTLRDPRAPGRYPGEDETLTLVSPDATEMNPTVATLDTFQKALGIPEDTTPAQAAGDSTLPDTREHARELWPWFLLALLVLLLVENTLADRRRLARAQT